MPPKAFRFGSIPVTSPFLLSVSDIKISPSPGRHRPFMCDSPGFYVSSIYSESQIIIDQYHMDPVLML